MMAANVFGKIQTYVLLRVMICMAVLCLLVPSARAQENPLQLHDAFKLYDKSQDFKEPSGLAFHPDGKRLYAVSDNASAIFVLDTRGKILKRMAFDFKAKDLEGIAVAQDGNVLVLQEGAATIYVIDPVKRSLVDTVKLEQVEGYEPIRKLLTDAQKNNGYEGITVHPTTGAVFVAHEAGPRLLLELAPDLSALVRYWLLDKGAGFSSPEAKDDKLDVSGLSFDRLTGHMLITSDTGKSVFEFDMNTGTAKRHDLPGQKNKLKNAEGVTMDPSGQNLFVLTDNEKASRLYVYGWRP